MTHRLITRLAGRPALARSGGVAAGLCSMLVFAAPAIATTATGLAAGNQHSCALTSSGGVECWGDNSDGQLGDGTTTSSPTPVYVVGIGGSGTLSGVVAIAASGVHACALRSGGTVDCWGGNGQGDLGDGTTTGHSTPVPVVGVGGSGTLSGVVAIAAAGEFTSGSTCAVTTGGAVDCWGDNPQGRDRLLAALPLRGALLREGTDAFAEVL